MSNISFSSPTPLSSSPYAPPSEASPLKIEGVEVSQSTVELLRRTRGYTMFMGVLVFIVAALSGLVILGIAISTGSSSAYDMVTLIGVSIVCCSLSGVPALRLVQFSKAVKRLQATMALDDLDAALEAQRVLWKFVAIVAMITVFIYGLTFVSILLVGLNNGF